MALRDKLVTSYLHYYNAYSPNLAVWLNITVTSSNIKSHDPLSSGLIRSRGNYMRYTYTSIRPITTKKSRVLTYDQGFHP